VSDHIKGMLLSELFFKEAVKDIIEADFPDLQYSAGLIGYGSEVLGFDTERSADHHWGPRIMLFLNKKDIERKHTISEILSKKLPPVFRGYSTNFSKPDETGVQLLEEVKPDQQINHRVEFSTINSYFKEYLGIDPKKKLTIADWLILSEQKLRTVKYGRFFYDQLSVTEIQRKLEYYPRDIWLFLLASEWSKIGQEEPFIGRCRSVNDDLGSSIILLRIVQSIMRLCFIMEKEYVPYSKWFGSAFLQLRSAEKLNPILQKIITTTKFKEKEVHLLKAYEFIAEMHNDLGITKPLPVKVSAFYDRPYMVIHGDLFADEIIKNIRNDKIQNFRSNIGSVNQITNSVDLLENDQLLKKLKKLYQ